MLEELKEIIKDACPDADLVSITEDTLLQSDLGIDSLRMMVIVIEIEKKFNIKFKNFPYTKTVGDLLTLIKHVKS